MVVFATSTSCRFLHLHCQQHFDIMERVGGYEVLIPQHQEAHFAPESICINKSVGGFLKHS
ncbi:MAG TPA: hypothetical protein DCE42_25280 [Myxococcales bacterium]|nr:hypothetical protein [Myxococcales bacterium]